jgi:hypothetical protein
MYYSYRSDNKTDNERYLEDELERERQYRREEEQQREQERQERKRWYREQSRIDARTADNWHDAIQRQAWLFQAEVFPDGPVDDFFAQGAAACDRALELWADEAERVADEITALEQRIQELRDSIRINVGKQLATEGSSQGWKSIASEL